MVVRRQHPKPISAAGKVSAPGKSTKSSNSSAVSCKKAVKRLSFQLELKETDNRFTSPQLIRAIVYSFGKIDFDPCWHRSSAVGPRSYFDVRQGHDGLRDDWSGGVVFVNPPWSAQDRWLRRAHDQWQRGNVETVVCLVPAKTDARFFHETLVKDADVYFLKGRPHFFQEGGKSEPTMVSVMLVLFGATSVQKARLGAMVTGSWWRPDRPSSVRDGRADAASTHIVGSYSKVSCVAPYDEGRGTVLCMPFAAMPKSSSLATTVRAWGG